MKHYWRWSYLLLLLWALFEPGCAARGELSGAPAAVVVCSSHGVSATCIATGPGYTYLLSCGHGWYRPGQGHQPTEDERTKPMKFIFPTPATFASGPATSRLVALDVRNDLALVLLNWGPAPYVCPVRDLYDSPTQPKRLVAVGYDELKIPAVHREMHYAKSEGCWTVTRESMFHGSSGCSLQADGYLCGVYTGYPSDHMPRGIERDPARYKSYVLSSREGLWCRHSLIVKFLRGAGHGELLVRLSTSQPSSPVAATPKIADPRWAPYANKPPPVVPPGYVGKWVYDPTMPYSSAVEPYRWVGVGPCPPTTYSGTIPIKDIPSLRGLGKPPCPT